MPKQAMAYLNGHAEVIAKQPEKKIPPISPRARPSSSAGVDQVVVGEKRMMKITRMTAGNTTSTFSGGPGARTGRSGEIHPRQLDFLRPPPRLPR
jgi:hypothetical protein